MEHRATLGVGTGLSQDAFDVLATEADPPTVAQRRDEFTVAVEQPTGIDRREVGDPAVGVEADRVSLGRRLRRGVFVVLGAFLDTNVVIRHLTGDPPEQAARATAALTSAERLLLADLVVAECVYVLQSFYEVERPRIAELMRAAIALPSISVIDAPLLRRALELYEHDRLDFAEACLVAQAETTGVGAVLTFDRAVDKVKSVERIAP